MVAQLIVVFHQNVIRLERRCMQEFLCVANAITCHCGGVFDALLQQVVGRECNYNIETVKRIKNS